MIQFANQNLEVDVLALQALSSPSELLAAEHAAAGGQTCAITVTCCRTCVNTICRDTI